MKKPDKQTSNLPTHTFFYPIPFENGKMRITREMLTKHYEHVPKGYKAYMGIKDKYLSYEQGIFTASIQLPNDTAYKFYLRIERERLLIACSCGMPDQKLCKHGYFGLYQLAWQSEGLNLLKLFWPGANVKLKSGYKFIDVKLRPNEVYIDPKPEYGLIYRPGLGFNGQPGLDMGTTQVNKAASPVPSQDVFGYALIFSTGEYARSHLPFLLPFTGTTNKKGTAIAFYKQFIKRGKTAGNIFTNDQIILNEICYDMMDTVTGTGKLEERGDFRIWEKAIPPLLNMWRLAINKLKDQQYVCAYEANGFKRWFDKPSRNTTRECRVSADTLSVSFLLKENEDHYSLVPMITANGKELTLGIAKYPLFVVDTVSNHFYLVGSLQEEQLLNWLHFNHNKLTIMKEHFDEFNEQFLKPLAKGYPVLYFAYRSKKRVEYHIE